MSILGNDLIDILIYEGQLLHIFFIIYLHDTFIFFNVFSLEIFNELTAKDVAVKHHVAVFSNCVSNGFTSFTSLALRFPEGLMSHFSFLELAGLSEFLKATTIQHQFRDVL